MRRCVVACLAGASFLLVVGFARAQSSIQTLEQELQEAKQQHDEETTKSLTTFFTQIDAAMASPDAALELYQKAKGPMPDPVPVVSEHDSETVTERTDREALDNANLTRLATAVQLHCGMMHFAALFILKPNQPGLQEQWIAWLQSAAQSYPQMAPPPDAPPADPAPSDHKKKHANDAPPPGIRRPPAYYPEDIKGRSMRDSVISKYLGFKSWGDKEPGGWSLRGIPDLYKTKVLDPLRKNPTADTLAAWDVYIGLANADERDNNRWDDVVYPPLQFERACDDYAVTPGTEKLEALVNIIKSNSTYPGVDEWISRVGKLMDGYRKNRGIAPPTADSTVAATTSPDNPNVTVTTEKQGDATIVTTHTNAPATNAPPAVRQRTVIGAAPVMNMQSVMNAAPIINTQPLTNAAPVAPSPYPQ
jgi:hypothetical protein